MGEPRKFRNYFSISVLFHIVALTILIISFDFSPQVAVIKNSEKDMHFLNAVVMDAPPGPLPPSETTLAPPKIVEKTPPPEVKPEPPKPKVVEKVTPPPKPVEQKKVAVETPKPKAIAIPDPRKKQQEQELIEKQLLADLKKQTEKQKKIKHKEVERAFEKELKEQAEKSLQQQLLQEKNRLGSIQSAQVRGQVDKYKALITHAISLHWLVPANVNKNLTVELLIRVAPGGMVLDAQIVRSSGDVALDRSARAAVFKASPLPVPSEEQAFATFRQFILDAQPKNVFRRDSWLN